MAEYIERESLCKRINELADAAKEHSSCASGISEKNRYAGIWSGLCNALYEVQHSVPADVALVVHGRWESGNSICPLCSMDKFSGLDADIFADWQPKFCPNCGAKMDMKE